MFRCYCCSCEGQGFFGVMLVQPIMIMLSAFALDILNQYDPFFLCSHKIYFINVMSIKWAEFCYPLSSYWWMFCKTCKNPKFKQHYLCIDFFAIQNNNFVQSVIYFKEKSAKLNSFFNIMKMLIVKVKKCTCGYSNRTQKLLKKSWETNALTFRHIKGIVHPNMKIITPWFTHPQAILGVYDFLSFRWLLSELYLKNLFQAL